MLRGVEFFIVLGIHGDPSQGTLPFPSRFPPPALFLQASSCYLAMKATLVFPANLFFFLLFPLFFHLSARVSFSPLECPAVEVVEANVKK